MKLFRKKKEKESCCCGGNGRSEKTQDSSIKKDELGIKILGTGCTKCTTLEKATRTAVAELGLDYDVEHITDFSEIATYGVMSTPALVFNGKVISIGKVLTVDEVKALLSKQ